MDVPVLADQQKLTYVSSVQTQNVVWKDVLEGMDEEKESRKSMLSVRFDDAMTKLEEKNKLKNALLMWLVWFIFIFARGTVDNKSLLPVDDWN